MHRSGTTLLVDILQKLGVNMGKKLYHNKESVFFQKLNRFALQQANSSWDFPENLKFTDALYHTKLNSFLAQKTKGSLPPEHVSKLSHLRLAGTKVAWGFKDPVNTLFLSNWFTVYPKAKLIFIERDPFEVAFSLKKREDERLKNQSLQKRLIAKEQQLSHLPVYRLSYRILDLNQGVKVWKAYKNSFNTFEYNFNVPILKLDYQKVLDNPIETVSKIVDFVFEDQTVNTDVELISKQIDSGRKSALDFETRKNLEQIFFNDPELANFIK